MKELIAECEALRKRIAAVTPATAFLDGAANGIRTAEDNLKWHATSVAAKRADAAEGSSGASAQPPSPSQSAKAKS